jgi:hypothetical protein
MMEAFPSSAKRQRIASIDAVTSSLSQACCQQMCNLKFSALDVASLRAPFRSLTHSEWTLWIVERLKASVLVDGSFNFVVGGVPVCLHGFKRLYGISDHKFSTAQTQIDEMVPKKIRKPKPEKQWRTLLRNWMTEFVGLYADIHPTSTRKYLPIYFTREIVHKQAADYLESQIGYSLGRTSFDTFWKNEFKEVKCAKSFRMGSCDLCLLIKRIKLSNLGDHSCAEEMAKHTKMHSAAREYCTRMREKSISQPFSIMYLQYDGKKASHLPHITPLPKDTQNLPRVKTHVYGLLDFSSRINHNYIFLPHWETGANISISILYDHIVRSFRTMEHKRPHTLVLQVDNCCKEGKNRTVFAFAAHLVKFGWFRKVKIVSLIQGHTHDLIDQTFATWTTGERRICIESPYQLNRFIKAAFKNTKKCSYSVLRTVFDWTSLYAPSLCEFSKFQEARMFKIEKDDNNEVGMYYKTNSLEKQWRGFHLDELKFPIRICKNFISAAPMVIAPQPLKQSDLNIIANHRAYRDCFGGHDSAFWQHLAADSTNYLGNGFSFHGEGSFFF